MQNQTIYSKMDPKCRIIRKFDDKFLCGISRKEVLPLFGLIANLRLPLLCSVGYRTVPTMLSVWGRRRSGKWMDLVYRRVGQTFFVPNDDAYLRICHLSIWILKIQILKFPLFFFLYGSYSTTNWKEENWSGKASMILLKFDKLLIL